MRPRRIIAATIFPLIAAAAALSPAAASASAPAAVAATSAAANGASPTAADEAFRADLAGYLQSLGDALDAAASNPLIKGVADAHIKDAAAALGLAKAQIPNLDATQLQAAEGILGQHPTWASQPAAVKRALDSMSAVHRSIPSPFPGFLGNCAFGDPGTTVLRAEFYTSWAAQQVAAVAQAVAGGTPDSLEDTPLTIFAGAAFGVANEIAIGAGALLSSDLDCATAASNATLETTYPLDSGAFTPASSQISVDNLAAIAGDVKTTLDNTQTVVNTATAKLSGVINSLGIAQGTANSILATATDLQSRTDALLATIGTSADTDTTTAHGLANTTNTRMNTILANTASFQDLSIRAEIERDLAAPASPVEVLFALPASQGGYLERVRDIVATTFSNELAAGQGIGAGQLFLTRGDTAFANKQFEAAFIQYALAYQSAVG